MAALPTAHEAEKLVSRYNSLERERVSSLADECAKLWSNGAQLRDVVHYMFGVEGSPPDHASLFGSATPAISLGSRMAVVLWPHRDESKAISGIPLTEMPQLIREGAILPLAQAPSRYLKTPALVPLLDEFRPPSYFWRANMLYSILAGGDGNFEEVRNQPYSGPALEWFKEGLSHPVLLKAPNYRNTWEPQHQRSLPDPLDEWGLRYLEESFSFKFVNACTLLGHEYVSTLLGGLLPERSLRFLTTFHILTDHPLSQALLTAATVDLGSEDWFSFSRDHSNYFTERALEAELGAVPMQLLAEPLYRSLMELRAAGVEPLPLRALAELGTFDEASLSDYKAHLLLAARKHQESVARLGNKIDTVRRTVRFSAFGAAIAAEMAGDEHRWEAIAALVSGIVLDETVGDFVLKKLRESQLDHLVTQIFTAS